MLKDLIGELGVAAEVEYQLIDTPEDALRFGFRGSPTVLIEGLDPFADPQAPVGLSCRVYRTATGSAGSPPRDQLQAALLSQPQEGHS
jgi:hypothetical protein